LADQIAQGRSFEEMHEAVAERKAKLEHIDGLLKGATAAVKFEYKAFQRGVDEVLLDWKARLRKNSALAAQVMHKLLSERLLVTPVVKNGKVTSWVFEGKVHWHKFVEEVESGLYQSLKSMIDELVPREPLPEGITADDVKKHRLLFPEDKKKLDAAIRRG